MANHYIPNPPLVAHDSLQIFFEYDKEADWDFAVSEAGLSIPSKGINTSIADVFDIDISDHKENRRVPRNSVLDIRGGGTFLYYGNADILSKELSIWHKRGDYPNVILRFPYNIECELDGFKWSPEVRDLSERAIRIQNIVSMVRVIQPLVRRNRLERELAGIRLRNPLRIGRLTFHGDGFAFKVPKKGVFNKMFLQKEEHTCSYDRVQVEEKGARFSPEEVTVTVDGFPDARYVFKKGLTTLFGEHPLLYLIAPLVEALRSPESPSRFDSSEKSPAARLKALQGMLAASLITKEEFEAKRQEIVSTL